MRIGLGILLTLAVVALCGATFLALLESNAWWVRMTDFPRLQYAIALAALLVVLALARPVAGRLRLGLAVAALAALGYNAVKLAPYYPASDTATAPCAADRRLSVLVANVKLENRHAEALIEIVRDRDPDLFLALETNEWWDRRLAALSEEMPHSVKQITGSYFGMHLYSRLPLAESRAVFPVGQDAPAILADVELPTGTAVRFIGLHPRPPHPGQSSTGRDAELMWAGLRARSADRPVIVAGDLNSVPWERGAERMQRIGRLIDPRMAAGFLPTYDAKSWWMAWPLDQVLYQAGLDLLSMEVLPGFGSDHYPVEVTLCRRRSGLAPPEPRPGDLEEAETTIETALAGEAGQR